MWGAPSPTFSEKIRAVVKLPPPHTKNRSLFFRCINDSGSQMAPPGAPWAQQRPRGTPGAGKPQTRRTPGCGSREHVARYDGSVWAGSSAHCPGGRELSGFMRILHCKAAPVSSSFVGKATQCGTDCAWLCFPDGIRNPPSRQELPPPGPLGELWLASWRPHFPRKMSSQSFHVTVLSAQVSLSTESAHVHRGVLRPRVTVTGQCECVCKC